MNKFNIVSEPYTLHGFKIPVGAMYGYDERGIWICLNYRVRRGNKISHGSYTRKWNKDGKLYVEITPTKYENYLRLFRLNRTDIPTQKLSKYDAHVPWHKVEEYSKTTENILRIAKKFSDKTYKALKKQEKNASYAGINENGELCIVKYTKVSKNDAYAVASRLGYGNAWQRQGGI